MPLHIEHSSASRVPHLVIIAGGKGRRLAAVAGDLPKALVPVGGKPVLQHQLELAAAAGIHAVTIFGGYGADQIEAFIGDGSRFGLKAQVSVEPQPMGNAGALLHSLDALPEEFFVVYGDVMLAVDLPRLAQAHSERQADVTVMVHPNDHPYDSDLLETAADGWVTAMPACPHPGDQFFGNLVNAGLYVIRREALRPWSAAGGTQDFTKNVMPRLIARDMGTPARLQQVESDWQRGMLRFEASKRRRPAIFLDRDGTLNVAKGFLRHHDGLELIPGVGPALRTLRQADFRLVVLTNQPVIARGEASAADVAAMHRRLEWELGKEEAYLDGIYVCPHHPDRGFAGERTELKMPCNCRKPNTGLFERACRELLIDETRSWMVGDQTSDVEMARRAGLRAILVQTGAGGHDGRFNVAADYVVNDLRAAATVILNHMGLAPS
jgi:D,D-heptose 1,7-bisphosphate phosphatase